MGYAFTADEKALIKAAQRFTKKEVLPEAAAWERKGRLPKSALRAVSKAGFGLVLLPAAHGGPGLRYLVAARIEEEIAAGSLSLALPLFAHNYVGWSIAEHGTPAQRKAYLPKMLKGESLGIFCLTEPQSGSDAAAITTTAERKGKGWRISGEKSWITMAGQADFYIVYAQTQPGSGAKGIALFLVDGKTKGIEVVPPYDMLGGNALGMAGVRFKNCTVPEDCMLIPPGKGLQAAFAAIDVARASVASMCCGLLRAGLEEATAYVAKRQAFGGPVARFQGVQWMLADVATNLEAARLLADKAWMDLEQGGRASAAAAHAKKFATRVALSGLADCMQVMGANGMKDDYVVGRHLVAAKMAQYLDGATEIQNVVISRDLFGPYGIKG